MPRPDRSQPLVCVACLIHLVLLFNFRALVVEEEVLCGFTVSAFWYKKIDQIQSSDLLCFLFSHSCDRSGVARRYKYSGHHSLRPWWRQNISVFDRVDRKV
ncbi:hypothetical protein AVEN_267717-1 [Araneus ventricosus]|uniref:Secreted protein n=1 Tax=Araneus ventricosus TaxID=182803 RepID=A0A4Y2CXJ6_ARAVE|nr:hypothetical protein AVEN_267717-1 [Araneus ventricosus]